MGKENDNSKIMVKVPWPPVIIEEDELDHVGDPFGTQLTACGKLIKEITLSHNVVTNCPDCIAEITHRIKHPEVAEESISVVTHKKK